MHLNILIQSTNYTCTMNEYTILHKQIIPLPLIRKMGAIINVYDTASFL